MMDSTRDPNKIESTIAPGWYITGSPTVKAGIPVLSHPTQNVKIIAQVDPGGRVEVLDQKGIWLRIRLPNTQTGYITAASITPTHSNGITISTTHPPQNIQQTNGAVVPTAPPSAQIFMSGQNRSKFGGLGFGLLTFLVICMLIAGILIGTSAIVSCPFGTTNPYSGSCSVLSYPWTGTGLTLTVIGLIGVVIMTIVAFSNRSKRS